MFAYVHTLTALWQIHILYVVCYFLYDVCYFCMMCVICVLCLFVVPLPPGEIPFAVK
jgi:hypothetical protein